MKRCKLHAEESCRFQQPSSGMLAHVYSGATPAISASILGVHVFYLISSCRCSAWFMAEATEICWFDCHVHETIHGHPHLCGKQHSKLSSGSFTGSPQCLLALIYAMKTQYALLPLSVVYKWRDDWVFFLSTMVNIESWVAEHAYSHLTAAHYKHSVPLMTYRRFLWGHLG